jgi:pimeloyl-ACP methyl ester carboxylesterase
MWEPYLARFTERFRVITPDSRGHGRTNNPSGTLSYRLMADDMVAFVQALDLQKPLICGYSDGGQIALEFGMHYPDVPQALVLGGTMFKFTAEYRAWVRAAVGGDQSLNVDTEQFARDHPDWAASLQQIHGPDFWKTLLQQIKPMWASPLSFNYTPDDFARVAAPTLVLIGDRDDLVSVEQAVEMYRLLPHAELAVIPSADHGAFFSATVERFQLLMLDFLQRRSDQASQTNEM